MAKTIQRNGLPVISKDMDGIPMHSFADNSEWKNWEGVATPDDSTFYFKPPTDEAWLARTVQIDFSTNSDFHSPMLVEYFIHATNGTVFKSPKASVYKNIQSFMSKCPGFVKNLVADEGNFKFNTYTFTKRFDEDLVLWGSVPDNENLVEVPLGPHLSIYYLNNRPLMSHFTMKITDDQAYKDLEGNSVEVAEVRYPSVQIFDISSLLPE